MKSNYWRIANAIKMGWWAFRNPQTIDATNFKMLSEVLKLILTVATESRPRMCKIASIHPNTKENQDIVSLWAGAGMGADPYDRITELKKEVELLRLSLLEQQTKTP